MRLIFAGTPVFAQVCLESLINSNHEVAQVLTQPERPSGRGLKSSFTPVKQLALTAGIPVIQPRSLKLGGRYADDAVAAYTKLSRICADAVIVAAYGLILPPWLLELTKFGCFNIHPSLLPRWRGAAPIQRTIESGDSLTGITIIQMDEGLDTGAILAKKTVAVGYNQNAGQLHDLLAKLGAETILDVLNQLRLGKLTPFPQSVSGVSYASKISKSESMLDCNQPASTLSRKVYAFNPFPGSKLKLPNIVNPVKVWTAKAVEISKAYKYAVVGDIINQSPEGIDVVTGRGALRILELQRAGGRKQSAKTFMLGWKYKTNPH